MHAHPCGPGVPGAPSPPPAVPRPMGTRLEEKLTGFHRFRWSWGLAEAPGHRAASLTLSRGQGCRVRAAASAEPLGRPLILLPRTQALSALSGQPAAPSRPRRACPCGLFPSRASGDPSEPVPLPAAAAPQLDPGTPLRPRGHSALRCLVSAPSPGEGSWERAAGRS